MSVFRGLLVMLGVGAALAGCGSGADSPREKPRQPGPTEDGLAGRLVVKPDPVEAGETIGIAVENTGEVPLLHGLGSQVERRVEGGWEDATEDVFGESRVVPLIGLSVEPGKRSGPGYGQVSDRITLPRDLEPGTYRVRKGASRNKWRVSAERGSGSATLEATFTVRDPADDRRP